jgi:hypothetical protein
VKFTHVLGLPIGVLVYTYILSLEKVKCRSVSESNVTASLCFDGLMASMLGGEMKQRKSASWDALLCSLLKLVNKLVQTPLASHAHVSCSNYGIQQCTCIFLYVLCFDYRH